MLGCNYHRNNNHFIQLMIRHLVFLISLTIASTCTLMSADASDSLRVYYSKLESTSKVVQVLQQENAKLTSEVALLHAAISVQSKEVDSLKSLMSDTNNNISALTDSLNINLCTTKEQIESNSATILKKSQTGMWLFIFLVLAVGAIAFIFGKLIAKRGDEVASLSAKADKLNEEIVSLLSSEMSEMQSLSKQIGSLSTVTGGADTEQKLITTLADRITFMEMTLYKMDSTVRGHKQLSKSIRQMKDNLLANGYELVDMLGKEYHEGMKVTANFVEDENIPNGKQIITGIIKPQINYKGKMIQSAQITVSQNL